MNGLFGEYDSNITELEDKYSVKINLRDGRLKISGEESAVKRASKAVKYLLDITSKGTQPDIQKVNCVIDMIEDGNESEIMSLDSAGYVTA